MVAYFLQRRAVKRAAQLIKRLIAKRHPSERESPDAAGPRCRLAICLKCTAEGLLFEVDTAAAFAQAARDDHEDAVCRTGVRSHRFQTHGTSRGAVPIVARSLSITGVYELGFPSGASGSPPELQGS